MIMIVHWFRVLEVRYLRILFVSVHAARLNIDIHPNSQYPALIDTYYKLLACLLVDRVVPNEPHVYVT